MVTQTTLVEELQEIVGQDHARAPSGDSRRFVIDGLTPSAIVLPGTYEEAASVMRFANGQGLAVVPQGNGAATWVGNIARRYDIALSVSRLKAVIEYEPADLTMTCQAGVTFEDVHPKLSDNGQMIPFSPGASPSCIGRSLALPLSKSNEPGATARDCTIGMRIVTADGRIIRAGGRVVKNVAGYDLCKLFIGSMGTLGVIVEATIKLAPAPQANERLWLEFSSLTSVCGFASQLRRQGLSLRKIKLGRPMSLTDQSASPLGRFWLTIELSGSTAAVDRSVAEITGLLPSAGGTLDVTRVPAPAAMPAWTTAGDPLTCTASVVPSEVPSLIEEIDREIPGAFLEGSPLSGVVSMTWLGAGPDEERVKRARAITARLGGTIVVTGCDIELKRRIDVFGDPPPAFELMRRVKQEFDPKGILSPGRFVGRL